MGITTYFYARSRRHDGSFGKHVAGRGESKLTPRMLAHIPENVLPAKTREKIVPVTAPALKLSRAVLIEGLSGLRAETYVAEVKVGRDLSDMCAKPRNFSDLVAVMGLVFGTGHLVSMTPQDADWTVTAGLGQMERSPFPQFRDKLGITFCFQLGNKNIATFWVPLDITVDGSCEIRR